MIQKQPVHDILPTWQDGCRVSNIRRWWAVGIYKKGGVKVPIEALITIIISAIALAFSVYTWQRSSKRTDTKDIEERVKENTRINFKLDTIAGTTQEIKTEISSMRDDIKSHNDRLIKVEESCKSAHHRLDGLEQRLDGEKGD